MYVVFYVLGFHVFGLVSVMLYGSGSPVWFQHTLAEYVGAGLALGILESLLFVRRMVSYVVYLFRYVPSCRGHLGSHTRGDSGNRIVFVLYYLVARSSSYASILSVDV